MQGVSRQIIGGPRIEVRASQTELPVTHQPQWNTFATMMVRRPRRQHPTALTTIVRASKG
ncbi:hypothetical protein Mal4_54550 [Maioricimonas rarisocia]|uniref:Uncharacterized protein n=1 Tax=Maioricimonas rarisocia TaxID=2528026 RepID=A0A517ZF23_9PLAN|nr:hypothetical protein Mal4_54550 [Maioricimonas rarisocia]